MYPRITRSSAGMISVSEAVYQGIERSGSAPRRHVMVPNAPPRVIPTGSHTVQEFRDSVPGTGPLVGVVTRVDRRKGIEEFIEAAASVSSHKSVRFVVVGDSHDGAYMEDLHDRARRHDPRNVHFLGYRSDVGTVLRGLDLVVIPSYEEGRPLALLEALSLEKTIVATDIAGINDVVAHGATAYLVPPAQPAALASGIAAVLDDPQLARRLAANGAQLVRQRFDPDVTYAGCADLVEAWSMRGANGQHSD
jgi:glycosyltransferase involved in cell wall biosynthesis